MVTLILRYIFQSCLIDWYCLDPMKSFVWIKQKVFSSDRTINTQRAVSGETPTVKRHPAFESAARFLRLCPRLLQHPHQRASLARKARQLGIGTSYACYCAASHPQKRGCRMKSSKMIVILTFIFLLGTPSMISLGIKPTSLWSRNNRSTYESNSFIHLASNRQKCTRKNYNFHNAAKQQWIRSKKCKRRKASLLPHVTWTEEETPPMTNTDLVNTGDFSSATNNTTQWLRVPTASLPARYWALWSAFLCVFGAPPIPCQDHPWWAFALASSSLVDSLYIPISCD